MTLIDHHGWGSSLWRLFRSLLTLLVSLLLLTAAAVEAGRRLQPAAPGYDGRLVLTIEAPAGEA
jgi:hypothetical protein